MSEKAGDQVPIEENYHEIRLVLDCICYRHGDDCTIRSSHSFIHVDRYLGRYERGSPGQGPYFQRLMLKND